MADKLSRVQRSENMRRIKSGNTRPEILVRKAAHALGYRYRLHRSDLPGKPDLAFGPRRKAIFVHGCFWHQHENCADGREPKSNADYWRPKLARNLERDNAARSKLEAAGWRVLVIWECEAADEQALRGRLAAFLDD